MKNSNMAIKSLQALAFGAVVVALAGCGGGSSANAPTTGGDTVASTSSGAAATYVPKNTDAGVPVNRSTDDKDYKSLVAASLRYGHRSDPFQLTGEEASFDHQQNAERVMTSMGGFATEYTEPEAIEASVEPEEPQPYRRLAGVVVGDSVLALIDMGNGRPVELIRPGMKVPDTEWTVVSINEDQAVLHREGNVRPHTITVRLESPPENFGGGFTGGAAPGTGAPPRGPSGSGPTRGFGPGNQGKGQSGVG